MILNDGSGECGACVLEYLVNWLSISFSANLLCHNSANAFAIHSIFLYLALLRMTLSFLLVSS